MADALTPKAAAQSAMLAAAAMVKVTFLRESVLAAVLAHHDFFIYVLLHLYLKVPETLRKRQDCGSFEMGFDFDNDTSVESAGEPKSMPVG